MPALTAKPPWQEPSQFTARHVAVLRSACEAHTYKALLAVRMRAASPVTRSEPLSSVSVAPYFSNLMAISSDFFNVLIRCRRLPQRACKSVSRNFALAHRSKTCPTYSSTKTEIVRNDALRKRTSQ